MTETMTTTRNGDPATLNRRVRAALRKAGGRIAESYKSGRIKNLRHTSEGYDVERVYTYDIVPGSRPIRYVTRTRYVTVGYSHGNIFTATPHDDRKRSEKMDAALAALQAAGFDVKVERFDDHYREELRGRIATITVPAE